MPALGWGSVISLRIFTRTTCPGYDWRMLPELPLLRSSSPASSLMPNLFRYLRASYTLIGHDLPNGKFATGSLSFFYKRFNTSTAMMMQKPHTFLLQSESGKPATEAISIFLQAIRHVHRHDGAKTKRFLLKSKVSKHE